jgi:hypothetical protein
VGRKNCVRCVVCHTPMKTVGIRGVCLTCHRDPAKRPAASDPPIFSVVKNSPAPRQGRVPADPTPFFPGTAEKMEVMRNRAARGESCFHPDDAKPDESVTNTWRFTQREIDDDYD